MFNTTYQYKTPDVQLIYQVKGHMFYVQMRVLYFARKTHTCEYGCIWL